MTPVTIPNVHRHRESGVTLGGIAMWKRLSPSSTTCTLIMAPSLRRSSDIGMAEVTIDEMSPRTSVRIPTLAKR